MEIFKGINDIMENYISKLREGMKSSLIKDLHSGSWYNPNYPEIIYGYDPSNDNVFKEIKIQPVIYYTDYTLVKIFSETYYYFDKSSKVILERKEFYGVY